MDIKEKLQAELAKYKQNKLKFEKKKIEYNKAEQQFSLTHKKHLKVYTDVLAIMGSIEYKAIEEYGHDSRYNSLKSSYDPYGYWYPVDIKNISYKDNGILIKYTRVKDLREGDYKRYFYKTFIPYKYFDLDEKTLRETHFKWSRLKIQELLNIAKERTEKKQFDDAYNTYQKLKKKFE